MIPDPSKKQEFCPAAPDPALRELLVLSRVCRLPLLSGESCEGSAGDLCCCLVGVAKGALTLSSYARSEMLSAGQAVALYQCGEFSVQAVGESLCFLIWLEGELPGRLLKDRLAEGAALFPRGGAAVKEAALSLAVLEQEQSPINGTAASAHAYTLLTNLLSSPAPREEKELDGSLTPLVEAAVGIIQEEFPFLEGLDELADRLEVSKSHLIRTFTQKTGISPGRYITHLRVEYAKLLLQGEDVSITYVAEASGFANANYFAKVFRRETGLSPSEYAQSQPRQARQARPKRGPFPW